MDVRRIVGANLKRLRIAAGLTQEQLAERSGFSQQYLSETENGKRNPSVVSLYEIGEALGVSLVQLVQTANDQET